MFDWVLPSCTIRWLDAAMMRLWKKLVFVLVFATIFILLNWAWGNNILVPMGFYPGTQLICDVSNCTYALLWLLILDCCPIIQNGCCLGFSSKKYLRQISTLAINKYKIRKKGTIVTSTFEIEITNVPLFFLIFYLLVPTIESYLKYFLDENPQKQPLWCCPMMWPGRNL